MKLGVLTSGVSQQLEDALPIIRKDGFRHVEIQFAWGLEDGDRTPAQEERIAQLLRENEMTCTAILRNTFSGLSLDTTDQSSPAYQQALEGFRKTVQMAREYGCRLTRINSFDRHHVTFGYGGAEHHLSGGSRTWTKFLHLMEPICCLAEDAQVDVMIETGTSGLLHTAALMHRALKELDCPRLYALWDPANCLYVGERPYPDGYALLRGKIAEIHIKDLRFRRQLAEITYCPVGRGAMTPYLEDLAAALHQDGFAGGVILENQVTPPGGTELDGYRLSVRAFRDFFAPDGQRRENS